MEIKDVWSVFKCSSMNDADMQRVFKRAATPNACIELLEENEELTQKINTLLKWCDTNIRDRTLVSSFALQIRDLLES